MDDLYEYSEDNKYRLCVWNTRKAPTLGYCKWAVYEYVPEIGWTKVNGGIWPVTVDVALRDAKRALADAVEYDPLYAEGDR